MPQSPESLAAVSGFGAWSLPRFLDEERVQSPSLGMVCLLTAGRRTLGTRLGEERDAPEGT